MKRPPSPLSGIVLMLGATTLFAGMTACNKATLAHGVPLPLLMLVRGLVSLVILLPWMVDRGLPAFATRRPLLHLSRGLLGVGASGLAAAAIALIPLADVIALSQARPLWLLVIAVLFLNEKVGWRRPLAAVIGFAGVLLIGIVEGRNGPGFSPELGTILAVLASVCGASVAALVRRMASVGEPPFRVVFWYSVIASIAWLPPSLYWWRTPALLDWGLLAAAASFATAGDFLASMASRRAEASLLAPVEFAQVPVGAAIGFAVFGEVPGWPLVAGAALMGVSVAYIARREAALRRHGRR